MNKCHRRLFIYTLCVFPNAEVWQPHVFNKNN